MKTMRTIFASMYLFFVCASPSFAAGSTKVYNSGILVLAFLGFCALVVVIQLIPAIITLAGMLKGMAEKNPEGAKARNR